MSDARNSPTTNAPLLAPIALERAKVLGVPQDGRSRAARRCDNVKGGLISACLRKYARAPSLLSHEQGNPAAQQAHARMEETESDYIAGSAMGASRESRNQLERRHHDAVVAWLRIATAGWPTAASHRETEARRAKENAYED